MKHALRDLPKDEQGRVVFGSPHDKGCRHCGAVTYKVSADNKVIWYHPAVECCEEAIRALIDGLKRSAEYERDLRNRPNSRAPYLARILEAEMDVERLETKLQEVSSA